MHEKYLLKASRFPQDFTSPPENDCQAILLFFVGAAQNVVPVAVTAGDKIEGLRQWASGRCLSADWAGVYSPEQEQDRASATGSRARRVMREPEVNSRRSFEASLYYRGVVPQAASETKARKERPWCSCSPQPICHDALATTCHVHFSRIFFSANVKSEHFTDTSKHSVGISTPAQEKYCLLLA